MGYPPITLVITTFIPEGEAELKRWRVIHDTFDSWITYLRYAGEISWHIADDGSPNTFHNIEGWESEYPIASFSRQERHGVGASLNAGFKKAVETSPLVAYFVDDWSLTEPLDLTPWAQLLLERKDVGMVRLGPPHPSVLGQVEIFTDNWQGWGLRLARDAYAFAHRPALYHQRLIDSYGWFKEDCSALECERDYNERFVTGTGPDVVLALPHPWQHLYSVELSSMEPR